MSRGSFFKSWASFMVVTFGYHLLLRRHLKHFWTLSSFVKDFPKEWRLFTMSVNRVKFSFMDSLEAILNNLYLWRKILVSVSLTWLVLLYVTMSLFNISCAKVQEEILSNSSPFKLQYVKVYGFIVLRYELNVTLFVIILITFRDLDSFSFSYTMSMAIFW